MTNRDWLAERFEANRAHLRTVAVRMLGSTSAADDAVQEAWLNLSRADTTGVQNLGGWLTTVVARVCLDMLRPRKSRPEEPMGDRVLEPIAEGANPEHEVVLADSVGLAVLVVLEHLAPAERVAFVLRRAVHCSRRKAGECRPAQVWRSIVILSAAKSPSSSAANESACRNRPSPRISLPRFGTKLPGHGMALRKLRMTTSGAALVVPGV